MEDNNNNKASSTIPNSGSYYFLNALLGSLSSSDSSTEEPSSDRVTLEQAYQQASFRNYKLKKTDNKPLRYFVLGCQGSKSDHQKAVAELMARIAADPLHKPDFILILGDNFYDDGVNSPTSPAFKDYFYDIYKKLTLLNLPFFIALGNHDANRHAKTFYKKSGKEFIYLTPPPFGRVVEKNQIMHSYLSNEDQKKSNLTGELYADPEKIALYQQSELNIDALPTWNMPSEAYGLHDDNVQIFVLNSNNYLRDYLKDGPSEKNQSKWLVEEYKKAKAAGKKVIFDLHHSFETEGKRAFPNKHDATHYLNPEKLAAIQQKLGTNTNSYNELLALTFEQQGIWPDQIQAAHDHFINYRNTQFDAGAKRKFSQLTLGGGGGDHHPRRSFRGHPSSFHVEDSGFAEVTVDDEGINACVYTTSGMKFNFTDQHHLPERPFNADDRIETLRGSILFRCSEYIASLKKKETDHIIPAPYSGGFFGMVSSALSAVTGTVYAGYSYVKGDPTEAIVEVVHRIMAYLNQADPLPDYEFVLADLKKMLSKLDNLLTNEDVIKFIIPIKNLLSENSNDNSNSSVPGTPTLGFNN